ncbi:MAG: alanine racemase [Alphaproteobacteria bacterium]|nr:alanine racemase [Alphaproteobacteria bacterium]
MQSLLATKSISDALSLSPHVTSALEIDTEAIAYNYNTLKKQLPQSICGAVLKADAYGFGIQAVAPVLAQQGCQHFFVAHIEEGIFLRNLLKTPTIYVLSGILPNTEEYFIEHSLTPILNDFNMVKNWAAESQKRDKKLPCGLHIDTGMRRNGFDQLDLEKLFKDLTLLKFLDVHFIMSHLVSSHAPHDSLNDQQKELFDQIRKKFPLTKASLADTGGIYLDPTFHYDLIRPGKGLFGLYTPPKDHPSLKSCLRFLGRILQVRTAYKGESVGYGASHTLTRDSKLATIGVGFADGYDLRLSNNAFIAFGQFKAPVLGRISMDYTVIDVTDIPESLCYVGGWAELVNQAITLDTLAHSLGTHSRALSTGFTSRVTRVYR